MGKQSTNRGLGAILFPRFNSHYRKATEALGESRLFVMLAASLLDDPSSSIEMSMDSRRSGTGSRKVTGYCDGKKEVRDLY